MCLDRLFGSKLIYECQACKSEMDEYAFFDYNLKLNNYAGKINKRTRSYNASN